MAATPDVAVLDSISVAPSNVNKWVSSLIITVLPIPPGTTTIINSCSGFFPESVAFRWLCIILNAHCCSLLKVMLFMTAFLPTILCLRAMTTSGNLGQPSIWWVIITQWWHLIDLPFGFSIYYRVFPVARKSFLTTGKTLKKNSLGGTWIFLSIFGKSMTVTGYLLQFFLLCTISHHSYLLFPVPLDYPNNNKQLVITYDAHAYSSLLLYPVSPYTSGIFCWKKY